MSKNIDFFNQNKNIIIRRDVKFDENILACKPSSAGVPPLACEPDSAYELDGLKDQIKSNMDDKVVEDHIEHQQQVLQLSKDNPTLVQNQMKQQEDQHHIKRSSEAVTGSRTREVRSISECLSIWKNFPVEDSTWEDDNAIQKHQEIIKR